MYLPTRGVSCELTGVISMMTTCMTEYESSTVMPSDIFSPQPGGSQKTPSVMNRTNVTGAMMLNT